MNFVKKINILVIALGLSFAVGQVKADSWSNGYFTSSLANELTNGIEKLLAGHPYFSKHPNQAGVTAAVSGSCAVGLGYLLVMLTRVGAEELIYKVKMSRALKKQALKKQQEEQQLQTQEKQEVEEVCGEMAVKAVSGQ